MEPTPNPDGAEPSIVRRLSAAASGTAGAAMRRRDQLVAALELLRERRAMDAKHEATIVAAFERGDEDVRETIIDLVERLEVANFGKVVIDIGQKAKAMASTMTEPGFERGLVKALVGDHEGAIQDAIAQGRRALAAGETVNAEKALLRWSVDGIEKMEDALVRLLVGAGTLLMVVAALWAAYQVDGLEQLVLLVSIGLLAMLGLGLVAWSAQVSKWARASRMEIEDFLKETPSQRLSGFMDRGEAQAPAAAVSLDPPTDK